ncbi:MAG: hypothetical protein IPM74_04820 [Crocinitomicaceae bacterium]|nr:hypothetical protein [Crocinitomicaceae bacterium]MBK8925228.1 hypothetical protein [Crocinitomicaceae bacterium]
MSFAKGQTCIYSTNSEHDALIKQHRLIEAGLDVVLLNKKDSSYGTFGQIELYVPVLQVEKAKLILSKLNE